MSKFVLNNELPHLETNMSNWIQNRLLTSVTFYNWSLYKSQTHLENLEHDCKVLSPNRALRRLQ